METFVAICVMIIVGAGILIGTLLVGFLIAWVGGDKEDTVPFAWILSSIVAICSILCLLGEHGVLE